MLLDRDSKRGNKMYNIHVTTVLWQVLNLCFPAWAAECLQLCKEFSNFVVGIDIGGEEELPLDPEIIRVFQVKFVNISRQLTDDLACLFEITDALNSWNINCYLNVKYLIQKDKI